MGKRIARALLVAAAVADCAMTAVLFIRAIRPTAEERLDEKVEHAMAEMTRAKYSAEPVASERRIADEADEEKDPIDEGFENIMRFSVNGKTGFEFD